MSSRILALSFRAFARPSTTLSSYSSRAFQTSSRRADAVATTAAPVRRPIGAFRGGIVGFLLGGGVAGTLVYKYILDEYKVSNELLTEDIYALQAAVQRIHSYVTTLEEKVDALQKKK
ncbi:hypothetical protein MMC30_006029 [Trapelia coarctata]|nr:hypothetical protein [Trapelia coarctata]